MQILVDADARFEAAFEKLVSGVHDRANCNMNKEAAT